jgi:hypothetical protein
MVAVDNPFAHIHNGHVATEIVRGAERSKVIEQQRSRRAAALHSKRLEENLSSTSLFRCYCFRFFFLAKKRRLCVCAHRCTVREGVDGRKSAGIEAARGRRFAIDAVRFGAAVRARSRNASGTAQRRADQQESTDNRNAIFITTKRKTSIGAKQYVVADQSTCTASAQQNHHRIMLCQRHRR